MSWVYVRSIGQITVIAIAAMFCRPAFGQDVRDPVRLLEDADKLAWVKAWTRAAPLYGEAERLFSASGIVGTRCMPRSIASAATFRAWRFRTSRSASRNISKTRSSRATTRCVSVVWSSGETEKTWIPFSPSNRGVKRWRSPNDSATRDGRIARAVNSDWLPSYSATSAQACPGSVKRSPSRSRAAIPSRSSAGSRSSDTATFSWAERSSRWIIRPGAQGRCHRFRASNSR